MLVCVACAKLQEFFSNISYSSAKLAVLYMNKLQQGIEFVIVHQVPWGCFVNACPPGSLPCIIPLINDLLLQSIHCSRMSVSDTPFDV